MCLVHSCFSSSPILYVFACLQLISSCHYLPLKQNALEDNYSVCKKELSNAILKVTVFLSDPWGDTMFSNYIIIQNQAPNTHMCMFYINIIFLVSLEILPNYGSKSEIGIMAIHL